MSKFYSVVIKRQDTGAILIDESLSFFSEIPRKHDEFTYMGIYYGVVNRVQHFVTGQSHRVELTVTGRK